METIEIKESQYTPYILLDSSGKVIFRGRSYPENTFEFYSEVLSWLREYFKNPASKTVVDFEIIYFNSSSSKVFFEIFDILEENKERVEVNWIYDEDNDVALEAGEDFKDDFTELKISLVQKNAS